MADAHLGPVRTVARLGADVIDAGVAVVIAPAQWVSGGLRRYSEHGAAPEPPAPAAADPPPPKK
jgi:hypothetical protein